MSDEPKILYEKKIELVDDDLFANIIAIDKGDKVECKTFLSGNSIKGGYGFEEIRVVTKTENEQKDADEITFFCFNALSFFENLQKRNGAMNESR